MGFTLTCVTSSGQRLCRPRHAESHAAPSYTDFYTPTSSRCRSTIVAPSNCQFV
jgi:hypothetical protein